MDLEVASGCEILFQSTNGFESCFHVQLILRLQVMWGQAWVVVHSWWPYIICAHNCHCRQYKSMAHLFFFPWLAFCSSKMCLVLPRHILTLSIHFLGSCYAGSKTCITWVQSVSGHHSSCWGKKIDQAKGKQYFCTLPAIATIYTYIVGVCKHL
jgi:hypothetical protein